MRKIYVGNLPYNTTEDDLRGLFDPCGKIESADVIFDRYTGKSKGFAFIAFADEASVKEAVDNFDGKEVDGRRIKVSQAKEKAPGGRGDRERQGG